MTQLPPPAVDRRSGIDRRQTSLDAVSAAGSVTTSRPPSLPAPFTWSPSLERLRPRDPWVSVVRRAIADYRDGSVEELARSWDDATPISIYPSGRGQARLPGGGLLAVTYSGE